jgi:hypothetical protein
MRYRNYIVLNGMTAALKRIWKKAAMDNWATVLALAQ